MRAGIERNGAASAAAHNSEDNRAPSGLIKISSSPDLFSAPGIDHGHRHGQAAEERRSRPQVRQLGQRRQRPLHALLRQRAQGQGRGRGRQAHEPQRPRREPGGLLLLLRRAVPETLRLRARQGGAGPPSSFPASRAPPRAPPQRRAAAADVTQPLRRGVPVPPQWRAAEERRRTGRRVQRGAVAVAVAAAPVQPVAGRRLLRRGQRLRPRRQLRRPAQPCQGRLARQRNADEGIGGAQVRRLGLEPGVRGRLHAHLQQGEGGEEHPGQGAGGVRQGRRGRTWQRPQAARRRLRLLEPLVLWVVQIELARSMMEQLSVGM